MRGLSAGGALFAALLGCVHTGPRLPPPGREPFRIGREDVLEISVWRDPDLTRIVPVRPDGYVSMPIIGEVLAEGRTPLELASDVREKLAPYVQQPNVTVIVREVHSSRVYITGEVAHPGSYPLRGQLSLLQAVALAGGFSDFADRERILLIRQGENGGRFAVRYSDLVGGDGQGDVVLMPGDTVVVP